MEKQELRKGCIVQLNPRTVSNPMLAGCMMVVTETMPFGAKGYIQKTGIDEKQGNQAYYRAGWEEMELVGLALWIVQ